MLSLEFLNALGAILDKCFLHSGVYLKQECETNKDWYPGQKIHENDVFKYTLFGFIYKHEQAVLDEIVKALPNYVIVDVDYRRDDYKINIEEKEILSKIYEISNNKGLS